MAYVITEPCVGTCDTACAKACPVDCIAGPVPLDEIERTPPALRAARFPGVQLYIDAANCICCGACLPECPVGAIYDEDDVPAEQRHMIGVNARFFAR